MGIPGLLQFLKDAAEPISVRKYQGQAVAVDTYCWLHKGAFSCAEKLAKGEPTDQYVWYCMKFVDMLLTFGVRPILVFDGRNLPSKQEVEKARRERRTANLQKGRQLLREGKISEARECFTRSVSITPAMAHRLIKAARARGVDCIVAPYEADAQLAYLTKCHLAQAVITEDSDLLAFGCKKVILKMDKHGNGLEIDQNNLGRCRSLGNVFTEEKFRHMCILSGCDYLPSLHGIGLGKACKLLRLAKEPDILKVIRKMAQYLKMNLVVPEQYVEGFVRANNTFLYQLVFDPLGNKVVPLNPYPDHISVDTLTYAGRRFEEEIELQLAMGNLDIETLERIDDFNPHNSTTKALKGRSQSWTEPVGSTGPSIWSRASPRAHPAGLSPQPAASSGASTLPKGKERRLEGLRSPCRELQMKRSREESVLSDQDLLLQYCSSRQKRLRSEPQPAKPAVTRQPANRFATLLQRRNPDPEEDGEDTCSRFFSTCSSGHKAVDSLKHPADTPTSPPTPSPTSTPTPTLSPSPTSNPSPSPSPTSNPSPSPSPTSNPSPSPCPSPSPTSNPNPSPSRFLPSQSDKSGGWVCFQDTPSPPPPGSWTSPRPASHGSRLFNRPSNVPSAKQSPNLRLGGGSPEEAAAKASRSPRDQSAASTRPGSREDPPDSPLSQDSAYWSQSQPYRSPHGREEEAALDTSLPSEPEQRVPPAEAADEKAQRLRSKLPGLSKSRSSSCCPGPKTKTLGPARVSGLRKKVSNNENRPAVQATISSLWKSFSFQKNSPVMSLCEQ